ncbi:MAG: CDP-alcohol phosphatidyltransferase family protein [Anaerolineae bacterium]|nr:CDP-alcohol phosphatidyltransferase family protein [Anaerolineales bacterium]MCQ3978249.1 CDP-alcohol phosphatidyltransferase family protein [Anaerolineae bacterium]
MFTDVARKYLRFLYEPPARLFSAWGVSPNVVTIVGFLLMVGIAIVLAQGYLFLGGLLIIIAAIFDAVDGSLARMMGQTSRFGAFLDSTLDRYSEAMIFFGLFIHLSTQNQPASLILIYATVVGSLMVSYARARAEGIGVPLKDGLFTRFERVFLLVVGLLFNQLTLVLWILAIFSNLTALQRMYLVWRMTDGQKGG